MKDNIRIPKIPLKYNTMSHIIIKHCKKYHIPYIDLKIPDFPKKFKGLPKFKPLNRIN